VSSKIGASVEKMGPPRRLPIAVEVLTLTLAGCRAPSPARSDRPRLAIGVVVRDVTFRSAALGREMPYRVFLPAQIPPDRRLPVVYLLHGRGTDFREWSNDSDVASYAARGLILVMPEGNSSYYTNSATKPKDRYEDYLLEDLIPDVEARFPAATGRESRAVIGVSMGGFGAVRLALVRPELFVFAGGISAAIDAPTRRFNWRRWDQSVLFRSIFGPAGSELRRNSDPFLLARQADPEKTPYIYLTAGEQEPLLEPNERFAAILKQRGFASEFHTKPGGHDWNEWKMQVPGCFESLFAHIKPWT
jgi:putative tributyrin esterase